MLVWPRGLQSGLPPERIITGPPGRVGRPAAEWVCCASIPSSAATVRRVRSTHAAHRPSRIPAHDRRRPRGRQERVARRDDWRALGDRGTRAPGVRNHRGCVSRVPRPGRSRRTDPAEARGPRRRRHSGSRRRRRRDSRLDQGGTAARRAGARPTCMLRADGGRGTGLRRGGALFRHRRGSARSLVRGAAGDAAQRAR